MILPTKTLEDFSIYVLNQMGTAGKWERDREKEREMIDRSIDRWQRATERYRDGGRQKQTEGRTYKDDFMVHIRTISKFTLEPA